MSTLMIIKIDLSNKLVNSYMIQEIILILYLPFQNTYHLTDTHPGSLYNGYGGVAEITQARQLFLLIRHDQNEELAHYK